MSVSSSSSSSSHALNICPGLERAKFALRTIPPTPVLTLPVIDAQENEGSYWHNQLIVVLHDALPKNFPKVLCKLIRQFFEREYIRCTIISRLFKNLYIFPEQPEMIPYQAALIIAPKTFNSFVVLNPNPSRSIALIAQNNVGSEGTHRIHHPSQMPRWSEIPPRDDELLLSRYDYYNTVGGNPHSIVLIHSGSPQTLRMLHTFTLRVDCSVPALDQYVRDNPKVIAKAMSALRQRTKELVFLEKTPYIPVYLRFRSELLGHLKTYDMNFQPQYPFFHKHVTF